MKDNKDTINPGRIWFSNHHRYFLGTLAFSVLTIFIEIVRVSKSPEDKLYEGIASFITTIVLLSFPAVIHFFIWIKLLSKAEENKFCNFFDFTMFLSVGSFSTLHILYSAILFFENTQWLFIATLIIAVVIPVIMCLMILYVNFEVVEKENPQDEYSGKFHIRKNPFKTKGLKTEIFNFPFWRVLHFFAIFMSITYVFGFLIAIYDFGTDKRYLGNERGFYFEKVEAKHIFTTDSNSDKNISSNEQPSDNNSNVTNQNTKIGFSDPLTNQDKSKTKMPFCFYFASGDATLYPEDIKNGENSNKPFNTSGKDSKETETKIFIKTKNDSGMENLLDELDEKSSKNNKVLVFELHGYADSNSIDANYKSYSSNYELSEARIIALQNIIIDKIREKNILRIKPVEWMVFPHSDKKSGTKCDGFDPNIREPEYTSKFSRVVEVFVKEVDNQQITNITDIQENLAEVNRQSGEIKKKLEEITTSAKKYLNKEAINFERNPTILDYLYLSIGAITTNAAGDIKPATPTARFIISIISLFQIFFLVGFFNTLLSLQEPLSNYHKNPIPSDNSVENKEPNNPAKQENLDNPSDASG